MARRPRTAASPPSLPSVPRRPILAAGLALAAGSFGASAASAQEAPPLTGRVLAVGIPGAGAISPVGTFLPGGPTHDKPELAAYTHPGRVLDPERFLVASDSSFGAPRAVLDWPDGAILSLAPRGGDPLVVPADFAAEDGQAQALAGAVQLFAAQSPAFLNAVNNPQALTAPLPPVSHPLGISLGNAFGQLWFACAPVGYAGPGVNSVCDFTGLPLAGAPNAVAGGVFAGAMTNRAPQQTVAGGLTTGAVATALLGASPDESGRVVFAVACADGSVAQVHLEKGVDGLAPAGTIAPLLEIAPGAAAAATPLATRAGMALNWVPDPILYVSDPASNALVALALTDDGEVFRVMDVWRIAHPALAVPVDVAPAVPEVTSTGFASNSTLAGGADLYVANRGDGTVVRLSQDGRLVAQRRVELRGLGSLGPGRLNGVAVSSDAQRLWLTVSGPLPTFPGQEGAVVEVPAFGAAGR